MLYACVCVHLFGFFALVFFLTPRIVAVALAVRNRTSTINSLDLLLEVKRMEEQTDKLSGLFSNNECICIRGGKSLALRESFA